MKKAPSRIAYSRQPHSGNIRGEHPHVRAAHSENHNIGTCYGESSTLHTPT